MSQGLSNIKKRKKSLRRIAEVLGSYRLIESNFLFIPERTFMRNRDICIDDKICYAISIKYLSMIEFLLNSSSIKQRKIRIYGGNRRYSIMIKHSVDHRNLSIRIASRVALKSHIFFMACVRKMNKSRSKRTLTCYYFESRRKKRKESRI